MDSLSNQQCQAEPAAEPAPELAAKPPAVELAPTILDNFDEAPGSELLATLSNQQREGDPPAEPAAEPAAVEPASPIWDILDEAPGSKLLAIDGEGVAAGTGWRLLLSHVFTKFGSKAWEFATPLMLLYLTYPSLFAPAFYGMSIFLFKFFLGPYAGTWIDQTDRLRVVRVGIALQCVGVVVALIVIFCYVARDPHNFADVAAASTGAPAANPTAAPPGTAPAGARGATSFQGLQVLSLLLLICCGVLEAVGAMISAVAVKKDWVPTVWAAAESQLARLNVAMSNIDLGAEIFGPIVAGLLLDLPVAGLGFVLVGLVNVLTFGMELQLLRRVFHANAQLREPREAPAAPGANRLVAALRAWPTFLRQPPGVPLLVVSYALLYFTVLSPHGVVLTAYLKTRGLPGNALALFRAAGALAGVAGMAAFRVGERLPRVGLRKTCLVQLWVLGAAVIGAAVVYVVEPMGGRGLTPSMAAFLGLITLSRFGLYGFDVGLLQLEQLHVDERHRGEVGAIESSLCTLGTGMVFVATLATPSGPAAFGWIVVASCGFVVSGALCYSTWYAFYHEHEHTHKPPETAAVPADVADEAAKGGPSRSGHGHAHGEGGTAAHPTHEHAHGDHFSHPHTTQQKRALELGNGTHTHLHFHLPRFLRRLSAA